MKTITFRQNIVDMNNNSHINNFLKDKKVLHINTFQVNKEAINIIIFYEENL